MYDHDGAGRRGTSAGAGAARAGASYHSDEGSRAPSGATGKKNPPRATSA